MNPSKSSYLKLVKLSETYKSGLRGSSTVSAEPSVKETAFWFMNLRNTIEAETNNNYSLANDTNAGVVFDRRKQDAHALIEIEYGQEIVLFPLIPKDTPIIQHLMKIVGSFANKIQSGQIKPGQYSD